MRSIRAKLIILLSVLIVIIFAITGYVLIDRKTKELTSDISTNALNFATLTSASIIDTYKLYYLSQGFSYFNRDMTSIFALNHDVDSVSILSYQGELLYNSQEEKTAQYSGPKRLVQDNHLLDRIQDVKPSLLTTNGRTIYLLSSGGNYVSVDKNEKSVSPITENERVSSILFPSGDQYRVLFSLSYKNLDKRIIDMIMSITILLVIFAVAAIGIASYFSSRIVEPVKVLMKGALEIGKGNLNIAVSVKSNDELRHLADTFNTMARDLHKSTLLLVEKERMGKELEIARDIQKNLLPKNMTIPGLDVAAGVIPALEIGGDCFDFIPIDNHKTLLYIGDVTGHGVPSGLVGSMANSLIYAYSGVHEHPKDILTAANHILQMKTSKDMFITMLMASWDSNASVLTYTQAGHDPLFHYRANTQELVMGERGGMALGLVPDLSKVVQEENIHLSSNDVLVLYTDGFPESFRYGQDGKREIMGFKRFSEIVRDAVTQPSAAAIYDLIIRHTHDFTGTYPQFDDMTLIVLRKTDST